MKKIICLLFFIILLCSSCRVHYNSKPFNKNEVANAPSYANDNHWAVLPHKIPKQLEPFLDSVAAEPYADVFFVYPTMLIDKNDATWNADINDAILNKRILDKSVHYQASAWAGVGRIFVPYYRQSHFRIYLEPYKGQSGDSHEIAYNDVKKAFEYYLEHYNNNRPIFIASHSQGSIHCKRLLKEFFDDKPLQNQLVAAYIIGTRINEDEFEVLKPMVKPNATGGYVVWNSYKRKNKPKRYDNWFKGGVTTNPITWDTEKNTSITQHKGLYYNNNKLYPQSITVEVNDGLLWVSVPKVPKRFLMSFIKSYHFADINLFWEDIRQNAQLRLDTYCTKMEY